MARKQEVAWICGLEQGKMQAKMQEMAAGLVKVACNGTATGLL